MVTSRILLSSDVLIDFLLKRESDHKMLTTPIAKVAIEMRHLIAVRGTEKLNSLQKCYQTYPKCEQHRFQQVVQYHPQAGLLPCSENPQSHSVQHNSYFYMVFSY